MRDFKQLQVWQKTHHFVLDVYRITQGFPSDERFGLVAQLRRASISAASNIAEGAGRKTDRDFARCLSLAAGSASEAEYQLLLARDLGYPPPDEHSRLDEQANEIKKMLNSFIRTLGDR